MRRAAFALIALFVLLTFAAAAEETSLGSVASSDDMTEVIDIVDEDMTPVTADMLVDGVYSIDVDVSSSMFKVTGCSLTVSGGQMTAKLYMKSAAYSYMYPGEAEQAAQTPVQSLVPLKEDDAGAYFELPVDALDTAYICAAYSARKEVWYPRTLVFRADSLPLEAVKPECLVTAVSLGLADGSYMSETALTGQGKASVATPSEIEVSDGVCTARIVFGTSKIDYIKLAGETFYPVSTENGAMFDIPVIAFDRGIALIVDSTAITPATEVPYTIIFSSEGLQ